MRSDPDPLTVDDPAWTAADLTEEAFRVEVLPAEAAPLERAVRSAREWQSLRRRDVPSETGALWGRIRRCLDRTAGFCLVTGLPFDGTEESARRVTFLAGYGLGTPIFQDAQGARLVDIRSKDTPVIDSVTYTPRADGTHARPYETRAAFRLHTDACDVAGLFCVQAAASGGASSLVSALSVYRRLASVRPDLLEVLREPLYYARPARQGEPRGYHGIPVFTFEQGYFKSHVVPDLVMASQLVPEVPRLSDAQREALLYMMDVAASPELLVQLRVAPGQLLLVDNHLVWHGRDAYEDAPGATRHLLRLWLATPTSRPLHPIHEAWFGSTRAGALRGGYLRERLRDLAEEA